MLSKVNRFSGHVSMLRVFRSGKTVRSRDLSLRFVLSKSDKMKVAVVVSKKVSKKAVVRNRIRRRVYSYFSLNERSLKKADYVLSVFDAGLAETARPEFDEKITELINKSGLWKDK